jgi:hypothetical protein
LTFSGLVHRAEQQILAARIYAVTSALGFDESASQVGQGAEGTFTSYSSQPAGEGWGPAPQVFAHESSLCVATDRELLRVELVFESVGLFGSHNTHEFQLETDVVVAFVGLGGNFQTKGTIERREVGQAVWLEKWIGFDVAVFDLVQRTATTGSVAEGSEVRCQKSIEGFRLELGFESGGRFCESWGSGRQGADGGLKQSRAVERDQPGPAFLRRVFVSLGEETV